MSSQDAPAPAQRSVQHTVAALLHLCHRTALRCESRRGSRKLCDGAQRGGHCNDLLQLDATGPQPDPQHHAEQHVQEEEVRRRDHTPVRPKLHGSVIRLRQDGADGVPRLHDVHPRVSFRGRPAAPPAARILLGGRQHPDAEHRRTCRPTSERQNTGPRPLLPG